MHRSSGVADLPAEEARERLRLLSRALEDGLLVVEDGFIAGANAALGRMLGVPADALIGRRVSEILATAEGRPTADPLPGEALRLRDAEGELLPVSIREAGEGLFLILDRGRERRLEREVWRLSERLRRLGGGSGGEPPGQEELLGMIEHEIRTAATVIRGYTRMLAEERVGPVNSTQLGFLGEVGRATERIGSLLDNLLEMASLEAGALPVVRKPVRLHAVVERAASELRPLLRERSMQLTLALEAERDAVFADAGRIGQVVLNLLSNAAKFGPPGSRISVETRLEPGGDALCLAVCDEGGGVAAEEAERIFEPFVQGAAALRAASGGVGLGLALCRRIVEAHQGRIEAVPDAGRGIFRVLLPLLDAAGQES